MSAEPGVIPEDLLKRMLPPDEKAEGRAVAVIEIVPSLFEIPSAFSGSGKMYFTLFSLMQEAPAGGIKTEPATGTAISRRWPCIRGSIFIGSAFQ